MPFRQIAFFLALCLAACTSKPPAAFDLDPAVDFTPQHARRGQLAVGLPEATKLIDSNRIVVRTGADSVAYLTGARWMQRLPPLVQARLIESFQNAHVLRSVGPLGINADRTLNTEIRRFEVDVVSDKAFAEISATLVGADGRVVATKTFSAEAPAPHDDAATVTGALDKALAEILHEIVVWAAPKAE
ncbi:MAG TPA: ABC-type transport auxiliary lipoprotein family protein [Methylovirgula sp.]|nr:ABC-type transport auxiliary lipoprotein family protein [Methylovirgula sp.]